MAAVMQRATLDDMPTTTTTDKALERRLRAHKRRREAHEERADELAAELAELAGEGRKAWGHYGAATRIARLAGVSRATVHRALGGS